MNVEDSPVGLVPLTQTFPAQPLAQGQRVRPTTPDTVYNLYRRDRQAWLLPHPPSASLATTRLEEDEAAALLVSWELEQPLFLAMS